MFSVLSLKWEKIQYKVAVKYRVRTFQLWFTVGRFKGQCPYQYNMTQLSLSYSFQSIMRVHMAAPVTPH